MGEHVGFDPFDDNADLLAGLRPPEGGGTRYVIDGYDGGGWPRYIPVKDIGEAPPEALPDPREDNGPETVHGLTVEELRRRERGAA
jgi:hypothetical protein